MCLIECLQHNSWSFFFFVLFDQFCLWSAEKKLDFSLAFCVCHVVVTIRDVEGGWDRIFQMIIFFLNVLE